MAKSYLITLSQSDLESIVFEAIARALKLNKLAITENDPNQTKKSSDKEIGKKKEVAHG